MAHPLVRIRHVSSRGKVTHLVYTREQIRAIPTDIWWEVFKSYEHGDYISIQSIVDYAIHTKALPADARENGDLVVTEQGGYKSSLIASDIEFNIRKEWVRLMNQTGFMADVMALCYLPLCDRGRDGGLMLNVKCYKWDVPPEMLDTAIDDVGTKVDVSDFLRDDHIDSFWNFDFDGDWMYDPKTEKSYSAKITGAGRSGGYLGIEDLSDCDFLRRIHDGDENDIIDCLLEYSGGEVCNYVGIDEVLSAINCKLREDVQQATRAFQYALDCKKYREECLVGLWQDDVYNHIDNGRYWLFDYSTASHVFHLDEDGDGHVTVSWPQHARVFKDHSQYVPCEEGDEGAVARWVDGTRGWWKPTDNPQPEALTFDVPIEEWRELHFVKTVLNRETAEAE